jgi:hypothetical protein
MDMAESHVVSVLVNKRAEIAGMIARAQQHLGQFRVDLVHLDAAIRLFAPAMEPETIPPKRIRHSDLWFERLSRRVLDVLRRAGAPVRAPDLVRAVMIDTGLDPADRASFVRVQWKVRDALNRLNKRGLLASSGAGHGVLPRGMLTAMQAAKVLALKHSSPSFTAMRQFATRFQGILRSGKLDKHDQWLREASRCGLQAIHRFARTVSHDLAAVKNASTERWSNGPVEGQINRLKMLKRAMVITAATDVSVSDRRHIRHGLRAIGTIEVVAQDRGDGAVGARADIDPALTRSFDTLSAVTAHQAEDTKTGAGCGLAARISSTRSAVAGPICAASRRSLAGVQSA